MSELDSPESAPVEAPPEAPPSEPSVVPETVEPQAEPEAAPTEEPDSFEVPEEGRYVPIAALAKERAKNRELKAQAERATALEQELAAARRRVEDSAPVVQAAQALIENARNFQQPQHAQPQAPQVDEELIAYAKDLELWDPATGQLDLPRAERIRSREIARAQQIAQQATAPMVVERLHSQAMHNLDRAQNTAMPDGTKADPEIVRQLWSQMAKQPGGLQSLSDANIAVNVWNQAYALSLANGRVQSGQTAATAAPVQRTAPLHTETAGGSAAAPTLNAGDRRTAKDLGISEAEYAKTLSQMPWRKR